MTRLILILSLASLACGMSALPSRPSPVSAPVPEKTEFPLDTYGIYYVTAREALTVRQEPSLDGTAIAWLENGQEVTIYACHLNLTDGIEWCDIGTGWVARSYLGE